MNKFLRLIRICACTALILCSFVGTTQAADYVGNFEKIPAVQDRPPQVGIWRLTPTVVVCELAPISETQTKSAVRFWKRLGYNFYRTQYKSSGGAALNTVCRDKTPTGYIVIHLVTNGVKMESKSLAQTHFYVNNETNEIEWAIIYMRPEIRAQVLEHEIGHALGFLHYNQINHLMHEKWTLGGWDKEGLENKQR